MVVVESTLCPILTPPLPLPLPLPSHLPNGIVTAKEWFKYVQAPSEYVPTTADCEKKKEKEVLFASRNIIDENPFVGKDSSRTSLASTSTSTSTTTLASITHESMNTDHLLSSKNSAQVKTTETELKMVIGTETEIANTDIVKSGDSRSRVSQINEYDRNGKSYQGGGHGDVGGDEKGSRAGVEDEDEGEGGGEEGGGGGEEGGGRGDEEEGGGEEGRGGGDEEEGGIKSSNGFLPTHRGMGRDVGRGMGSSSHNASANASAKPFLSDITKKSIKLLPMKQIHGIGENQIISENTDNLHEKSAFPVVNENFADRKVTDSVVHATPCHPMPCHAMPSYAMLCQAMPCHAMLCQAMPSYAMPCHAMPCHAVPCHAMPCHAMS